MADHFFTKSLPKVVSTIVIVYNYTLFLANMKGVLVFQKVIRKQFCVVHSVKVYFVKKLSQEWSFTSRNGLELQVSKDCLIFSQELHAHLNGSISSSTIQKLIEYKKSRTVDGFDVPKEWECCIAGNKKMTLEQSVYTFALL